ncbi:MULTISPECIES: sugar ABC transporter ATP-binding protein [Tsukamurella]|uniref:Sugar ABC transporter ATP-binding protein n=1 Tax=Tsukamurella strandjordii TaxID=147577 RepID=A0AA90SG62_9ACTN|nr:MULTISPECIES: sugar ABC transporter ATP-binding protein [Tsukamurella]MDP0397344.1 sugar ABC transporter ATP-binding protein [Tsukamurella strandjordii]GIZ98774.1 sugar ABC transporter ATP-binding protein [Tsukamurella sp. TY48]
MAHVTPEIDRVPTLTMRGIVKVFPGVRALDGVDLVARSGEVHCLLGQNGAGKSTLIKVLAGAHRPDEGTIELSGSRVEFRNPQDALSHGIATIYQELDLIDGLTVAENIYLGHEFSKGGVTAIGRTNAAAQALLARLGHPEISPTTEVGALPAAKQQVVSIARALSHLDDGEMNRQVVIMDEPTAVLDSGEVDGLFDVIERLRAAGAAVIYISHRLEEIRRLGDRITVLKDGRTVARDLSVAQTPTADLITLMTGRAIERVFDHLPAVDYSAAPILRVAGLGRRGEFGPIDFDVRPGEIFGIAGLVGSGRSEIMETIFGARKPDTGTVAVDGNPLRAGSVPAAVAAGLGLCPEERKSQGLVLDDTIARNITLASIDEWAHRGVIDQKAELAAANRVATQVELRPPDVQRVVGTLSGGNQQKVVLARWLLGDCRVLLLDEPTRGVDIGARREIYQLIAELATRRVAILVVSSELPEVLGLAHRVTVVADGRQVHTGPSDELDEHRVLDLVMEGNRQ